MLKTTWFGPTTTLEPKPLIDFKWFIIGVTIFIVSYLGIVPLAFLIWQSFSTPQTMTQAAEFTANNYVRAYTDPQTLVLFYNSFIFAAGTSAFSLVLGTLLAWMNERTNTPFKSLFYALAIIPLIIPSILFTVAWIFLASPEIGIFNLALQRLFNTDYVFFNIYSLGGMIWVEGLHYSPMAFLLMTAAFRSMDPSLEESAMMSGASIRHIVFKITMKLAWPALFAAVLIMFVRSIESFEVPALLGMPAGIQVFTSAIYNAIKRYPSDIGLAGSYAVTLLIITSIGVFFQSKISSSGSKYSTMTGKGYRPRAMDLGKWRYLTAGIFIVYFLLIVIIPFLVLVWSSLQRFYSVPSVQAFKTISFENYSYVLQYPSFLRSVSNSVLLSIGSATTIMLLTAVICWIVVKTRIRGRWMLDNIASLPMVFPGIVLGVSIMILYLQFDIGVYGTLWILFIAYLTRFMPYGLRYNTTSMMQIHKELEESAAMSGATWGTTFRRIILPLMKSGFVAGWIYVVIVSIRELSSSILLYSPGSEVISIVIWELWENGQYTKLSALGVMFIIALFILVIGMQLFTKRIGVKES
ncbi:ABC transporter permease [Paenibacillus abyssi]|uniref:Iron dicitrate ABC transporter permease n=1 Tax=Paenibacillus abyssi TaxID=1340531 RepID=A0A917CWR9_9BACL|nr:iron ABC transporter permease [Paenibacillus abyssi]GGG00978.1 iron dicitrate ABC transporter permease [Paenibacillus abyssi]